MLFSRKPAAPVTAETALPGRSTAIETASVHAVSGEALLGPVPAGLEEIYFAMGCFWGAERLFWQQPGICLTQVGYAGGHTPNPTYEEVCSGNTGHTEIVRLVFDPARIELDTLLQIFWENHDPTQGMRQGNDIGTQYRSAIYYSLAAHQPNVTASQQRYQAALSAAGRGQSPTEIRPLTAFNWA